MRSRRPAGQICSALLAAAAAAIAAAAIPIGVDDLAPGKDSYDRTCASCHGTDLRGSSHGAELRGPGFAEKWAGKPPQALRDYIRTYMPPGANAGALTAAAAMAITRYILESGNTPVPAAPVHTSGEFSPDDAAQQLAHSDNSIPVATAHFGGGSVRDFKPVENDTLENPPAGDWINWRRTLDGQAHSPLQKITRANVGQLKLAWSWAMRDGNNEPTPLVHDGIMFLVNAGNVVQALNAQTGEPIWEFVYRSAQTSAAPGGAMRNIAIYHDKILLNTSDAAVLGIDAVSGAERWRTIEADHEKGYSHSSGPVVADGVLISGMNGCERFKTGSCYIVAHDPDTGRELWRTSTIALPGDANNATWGKIEPEFRAGGDSWIPGSYDPVLHLFYVGTAQAKPWVAVTRGMKTSDAALYTGSTLALDPATGHINWFYQHLPGESLDMDVAFERVLVDLDRQKLLLTVGKDGILWKLDRLTGRYLDLVPTMYQNIYAEVDRHSGRLSYRADIVNAKAGDHLNACPGNFGGHNWPASSFVPEEATLIIPLTQACNEFVPEKPNLVATGGGYGASMHLMPMPEAHGNLGKLVSVNVRTMKPVWTYEQRTPFVGAVLTTAGGLAFTGSVDRMFRAFDVSSGKVLWEVRLGAPIQGFPITFMAGGRQFVAVSTGLGAFRFVTASLLPEIYQTTNGNELYVFELPERLH